MSYIPNEEETKNQAHADNIRYELEQLLAKHPDAPVLCLPTDENDCVKYTELTYGYSDAEESDGYIEKVSDDELEYGENELFDRIYDDESEKEENAELSDEEVEEIARAKYKELPWIKAIVIYHYEFRPLR